MLTYGMRDVNFPPGKDEHFLSACLFSSVKRALLHGQPVISHLFELYIFLYSAIHEEDTFFRLYNSARAGQRVGIRDSRDARNTKCQRGTFVISLSSFLFLHWDL